MNLPEFSVPLAQQTIQAILAPALMISACGLLLLGLNNRYTVIVARLRQLNDEKRRKLVDPEAIDREYVGALRFESLMRQIPILLTREGYLRTALIYLWVGVICYLLSSIALGVELGFPRSGLAIVAVWIFMIGLIAAAIGVVYALRDIILAHRVIRLETEIY